MSHIKTISELYDIAPSGALIRLSEANKWQRHPHSVDILYKLALEFHLSERAFANDCEKNCIVFRISA